MGGGHVSTVPAQPVRVRGDVALQLSRWLWVVKWLLAIPHYVVLLFLWIAFFGVSVIAFFAILFTGRYPRSLFDFNVGVLRWSWRVAFYTYGALGTDRYPPFTLAAEPGYPATLDIEYPEHLSRGLVLVKWLLAIPHYLVVSLFVGSLTWGWSDVADERFFVMRGGLIGLLVLFAAIALLFRGRYPRSIFDLVLGLDRWVLRVAAYVALMTDRYPPFRLDQGPDEPVSIEVGVVAPEPVPAVVAAAPTRPGWTVGRVLLVVFGSLVALVGAAILAAGVAAVVIDQTQRDDEGFLMSPSETFSSAGYAVVSESADVSIEGDEWAVRSFLGDVKIESDAIRPVFIGIAPATDADAYLGSVERSVVTDIERRPRYDEETGGAPATPPTGQTFWVASATGAGSQALTWKPESGDWVAVLMNADGSAGVEAELSIGAELDAVLWIGIGMLAGGVILVALGGLGIALGATRASRK
jgi:hypothetical protein